MIIIYGRRRIGKTALLKEFIKGKEALFFLATEESEAENRNAFKNAVAGYIHNPLLSQTNIDDWQTLFELIVKDRPDARKLIIIDEFQYIGKSNHAFISVLQKIWDTMLSDKNVMLILCGSLVHMMYAQTLSYDSPLYGRRTGQIRQGKALSGKRTGKSPPCAYSLHDPCYTAVENCVLSRESYLYEEPNFLLEKEVQDVGSYFSIIKTIAAGKEKPGEIAAALSVAQTNLPKYLGVLIDLDILEREVPVT